MGCLRGSPTTPTSSKTSTGRRRLAPPLTTGASGNRVGRISTICFDSKSGTSLPISHLMVCKMVCKRLLARESSRPPHDQHALSPAKTLCRAGGIRTHDPLTPRRAKAVSGRLWASGEFREIGERACAARGFGLWRTCADFGGFRARIVNGVQK